MCSSSRFVRYLACSSTHQSSEGTTRKRIFDFVVAPRSFCRYCGRMFEKKSIKQMRRRLDQCRQVHDEEMAAWEKSGIWPVTDPTKTPAFTWAPK